MKNSGITILDGGTATGLAEYGYCYEESIEEFILENPDKFAEVQRGFIESGAEIILTPTLTTNSGRLRSKGLESRCSELNRKLAELTAENVRSSGKSAKIAGDIGSCGYLMSQDDISFTELIAMYEKQVSALDDYVDIYFIETMLSIEEIRAAIFACRKTGKPIYVSISIDDEAQTYETRLSALSVLLCVQELGIDAFGFNCSTAKDILKALEIIMPYAKLPIIAKPCNTFYLQNDGNVPDNGEKITPIQVSPEEAKKDMARLIAAGASIVGGCCGTKKEHIAAIKELQKNPPIQQDYEKRDCTLCFSGYGESYFLEPDTTEISPALSCLPEMQEQISEVCSERYDILCIQINSPDDAIDFAKNAQYATLPVMFSSDNPIALKTALMLYQGRALADSQSQIEPEELKKICRKYGAVAY